MSGRKTLVLSAANVSISAVPARKTVLIRLDLADADQFLEHRLAIQMSPIEARQIAGALDRKADAIEDGSPEAQS